MTARLRHFRQCRGTVPFSGCSYLRHRTEAQRRLRNRLGIVVVVLLILVERFHVSRWDGPGLKSQPTRGTADKMRAQTSFHLDNITRQTLKHRHQRLPLCLLSQHKLAIVIKANQMKNIFVTIDAKWMTV